MNIKEKVKSTVTNVIEGWIDTELVEWPPDCMGFLYQLERPEKEIEVE